MSKVGIIAHAFSGKDIRRLVAQGWVVTNQEKIAIIRRLLCGLEAAGVEQVVYMPESGGLYRQALDSLGRPLKLDVEPVDIPITLSQADSTVAAAAMAGSSVEVIITLGGDGTNRAVFKGCGPEVAILPISTGTNNVFPQFQEGTTAGLAAGLVATSRVGRETATWRSKILRVERDDGQTDLALVDLAVVNNGVIGSKAVWDVSSLEKLFLTRAEPWNIGLSAIGGALEYIPPDSDFGMQLHFGAQGQRVEAAIVPGQFAAVSVAAYWQLRVGERVRLDFDHPVTLAFDGERDLVARPGQQLMVELASNGPMVLDVSRTLIAHTVGKQETIKKG